MPLLVIFTNAFLLFLCLNRVFFKPVCEKASASWSFFGKALSPSRGWFPMFKAGRPFTCLPCFSSFLLNAWSSPPGCLREGWGVWEVCSPFFFSVVRPPDIVLAYFPSRVRTPLMEVSVFSEAGRSRGEDRLVPRRDKHVLFPLYNARPVPAFSSRRRGPAFPLVIGRGLLLPRRVGCSPSRTTWLNLLFPFTPRRTLEQAALFLIPPRRPFRFLKLFRVPLWSLRGPIPCCPPSLAGRPF